ncbi:sigma-70 family RNA polymerase sigma factor [Flammeovirgaceae bacterium SG7u.111]|nr:sigma-70 family RNA polymerase sigma factor [Flammeovirgaceae bacterium SG7u.132]WPO36800.1 sigma-70 family RNA polymerase sigma factor [Flammeovirgaceae bacterium SG7u.111]
MEESFEKVLDDNKLKIYRMCRIYAAIPLEPQDLFQEVVFQLWKSFSSFKGNSSIDTWVYKVALNVCLRSKVKMDKSNNKTERFESINFIPVENDNNASEDEKFSTFEGVHYYIK